MSPIFRLARLRASAGAASAAPIVQPIWLPGDVEVAVVGETFYWEAITAASASTAPVAVLLPEPGNPHDPFAVGIHLNNRPAGHLSWEVARQVQAAIQAFIAANGGRPPTCPASIFQHDVGPEVVLHLGPARLGLTAGSFDTVPDLDCAIQRFLVLDRPVAVLTGIDHSGRPQLAAAEDQHETVDADYNREPGSWPRVEQMFLRAAAHLEQAGDPLTSAAWAGVAKSRRYQKGGREDRI
jgi:hypothetical protein